ncbi:MAG: hypothetical protein ACTHOE_14010 [Conexibacter sp.]
MDEAAQAALLEAAEGVMADAAAVEQPLSGRRTFVAYSAAGGAARSRVRQLDAQTGDYLGGWALSDTTEAALARLREAMARPDEGAWYWAVLEIGPEGELDARFFYDEPPEWEGLSLRLHPGDYRADLERHPRPPAGLPPWLRALLAAD